ncbi:fanconi-associated nuclease 1 [Hemicordylus capensis]|uniref:fanconi-associated nuclease 1 n=1 Tax=Hemicordylus capensis TaxID=884348 RepID=UPI002303C10E|nr:fanconi-associated nuclease 1 [Hemicordylus capensis]XP_053128060.1 fanconi-associated nuclease 1 [Hemicordylus capensis]
MAENGLPENKRPRRGLSLSRNKSKTPRRKYGAETEGALPPMPSASSSIISFFNNVPPARIACPLCGQVVPRFGINKHIDEVCQKSCGDAAAADVILVDSASDASTSPSTQNGPICSSPYFAKNILTPEKNPSPLEGSDLKAKEVTGEQRSPYFKKKDGPAPSASESRVHVVKKISLRGLSTKLSRRRHAQSGKLVAQEVETTSASDAHGSSVERNPEDVASEDGSQKENRLPSSRFQKWRSPKEYLLSNSETLGMAQEGDTGTLHIDLDDITSALVPLDGLACSERSQLAQSSEQQNSPQGSVPDLCTLAECPAPYSKVSLSDLETGELSPGQQVPLSNAEETCCSQMQCLSPVGSDVKVLPVEDRKDLRKEVVDHACLGPLEETSFHPSANILEMLANGPGLVSDSGGLPYYLRNFLMVLQAVLENEDDRRLFDEEDSDTIVKFCKLSVSGQKLYARLFQRKLCWIKVNKIEYAEISSDLSPVIEELAGAGFLQDETELEELPEVLDLLSAPELKTLAKAFHLTSPNAPKQQLLDEFLQLAKQRSIFSQNQAGVRSAILKRAKDLAGKSIRVCKGPRAVFSRVLLLFSLTDSMEDEEAGSGGQGQLSTVLMVNMGRIVFPTYTVNRKTPIFQDRDDFIRYATVAHMSNDISVAMTNGNWNEAHRLYEAAKETWQELRDYPSLRPHTALPEYLRHFTVGWMYTRILSRGVEILQRIHMYEEAVEQLQDLLDQEVYCTDSRGRWWDRLALNLHQHLKDTGKAVQCIRKGLLDPSVRTGHRLSLSQRAQRMKDSPACKKLRHLLQDLPVFSVEDVTHVTIKGKLCPQTGMGKSVFIMEDLGVKGQEEGQEPSTVVCSVEELALAHYKQDGFDQGIHGEGSTFCTLYGLLMWDIIFMDGIPDVFRNPYQASPLDLYTDSFYENRREAIESRLQLLQEASPETLKELIGDVWNSHAGEAAALVSWDRFSSLQQAQSLAGCLGGPFLSGVCQRLSRDLRHCRGGLPDLVVWKTEDHQFKLVEVKGPNDRLSYKQMVWLAELQRIGAVVEVCHVVAIGSKTKRLS